MSQKPCRQIEFWKEHGPNDWRVSNRFTVMHSLQFSDEGLEVFTDENIRSDPPPVPRELLELLLKENQCHYK